MKRTAQYETRPLNRGKRVLLLGLLDAFAGLKDLALRTLAGTKAWRYLDDRRRFRDTLKPCYRAGVPIHLQDQAVFEAVETLRRWIDSCITRVHLRSRLFALFAGAQRRYAFWLLQRYVRIGAVLRGEAPVPGFEIPVQERKAVVRRMRRLLRRSLGTPPRVRLRRSLTLDDTLYRVVEHEGRQYVTLSSLVRGRRLILPVRGKGAVRGNVRVVWNQDRRTASVHVTSGVRVPAQAAGGRGVGLDAGVTEVLAVSTGEKHGQGYGPLLERLSAETTRTGRARNKLHQLAKKVETRGDGAKASSIRRNNLGRRKLRASRARGEAAVKTLVGQAVRQALRNRPAVVAVEDLSHLRGRTKSRNLSRVVSRWARSALRERIEFRAQAGGSRLETVNAAYTSQTCPDPACGFVHKDNRHGDRFHCLQCGWDGDADVAAALNLLARVDDPEIHLWTPTEWVKAIADERFRRRKETGNPERRGVFRGNGAPLPAGLQQQPGSSGSAGSCRTRSPREQTLRAECEQYEKNLGV